MSSKGSYNATDNGIRHSWNGTGRVSVGLTTMTILIPLLVLTIAILAVRLFRQWRAGRDRYRKIDKPVSVVSWYSPEAIKNFMNTSQFGMNWLVGQVILSFLAFLFEIIEQYLSYYSPTLIILETAITFLFVIDYVLFFYCSKDRLLYIYSPFPLLDMITVVPTFVGQFSSQISSNSIALRSLRLLRVVRIVRVSRAIKFLRSRVEQEIFTLIALAVSMLLISASVVTVIEGLEFHDSLYFTVVTFTTVGYGDIIPITEYGRIAMMIMIVTALVLLSYKSSQLISIIQSTSPYSGSYVQKKITDKHIIILGTFSSHSLREFLSQIFARQHHTLKVVILNSRKPSLDIRHILTSMEHTNSVYYFVGSEMIESDLRRVMARSAAACYILGDRNGLQSDAQLDNNTILRCLSVKSYAPKIDIFVQLAATTNHAKTLQISPERLLVSDELSLRMIGSSILSPGFSTLLVNLFRSYSKCRGDLYGWQREYYHGSSQEVFTITLPSVFVGQTFQDVARIVYEEFFVILVGLESTQTNNDVELEPIPFDYVIKRHTRAVVISPGSQPAKQVEQYDGEHNTSLLHAMKALHKQKQMEKDEPTLKNRASTLARNFFSTDESALLYNDLHFIDVQISLEQHGSPTTPSPSADGFSSFVGDADDRKSEMPQTNTDLFDIDEFLGNDTQRQEEAILPQVQRSPVPPRERRTSSVIPIISQTLDSCTLTEVDLIGHVVIIGVFHRFVEVVQPLRMESLNRYVPILYMSEVPPTAEEWQVHLSHIPEVYYMQGLPLRDLDRAGITRASRVVLLREFQNITNKDDAQFLDSNSIITMRSIETNYKFHSVMSELALESSIKFLLRSSALDDQDTEMTQAQNEINQKWYQWTYRYENQPPVSFNIEFASGRVMTSSMIYSIVPQAYKNPLAFSLLQGLVTARKPKSTGQVYPCGLYQISIPSEFTGKVFQELFVFLLSKKMVALGLYRSSDVHLSRFPYVFTNPAPNVSLSKTDQVFVLSSVQPR